MQLPDHQSEKTAAEDQETDAAGGQPVLLLRRIRGAAGTQR